MTQEQYFSAQKLFRLHEETELQLNQLIALQKFGDSRVVVELRAGGYGAKGVVHGQEADFIVEQLKAIYQEKCKILKQQIEAL